MITVLRAASRTLDRSGVDLDRNRQGVAWARMHDGIRHRCGVTESSMIECDHLAALILGTYAGRGDR